MLVFGRSKFCSKISLPAPRRLMWSRNNTCESHFNISLSWHFEFDILICAYFCHFDVLSKIYKCFDNFKFTCFTFTGIAWLSVWPRWWILGNNYLQRADKAVDYHDGTLKTKLRFVLWKGESKKMSCTFSCVQLREAHEICEHWDFPIIDQNGQKRAELARLYSCVC